MKWSPLIGSGKLPSLKSAAAAGGLDPYLVWADATKFSGFACATGGRFDVAIELKDAGGLNSLRNLAQIPGMYGASTPRPTSCTGAVTPSTFKELLASGLVSRVEFAATAKPNGAADAYVTKGLESTFVPVATPAREPVIGIIDHGLAFAHRKFRRPTFPAGTRFERIWDQSRDVKLGLPWTKPPGTGYGRELDASAVDRLIVKHGDDEAGIYQAADYSPLFGRVVHGTHVLDIAAGWPNPLSPANSVADHAANAPILAVQLPWSPVKDTSGFPLCVNVLDALHYLLLHAAGRPLVVNLSDGAMAGSHNGKSILEKAMDELIDQHPNLHIVIAAGNAYDEKCHARKAVNPTKNMTLRWHVLPDDSTESFLEIWVDGGADDIEVRVAPPGTRAPDNPWTMVGDSKAWGSNSAESKYDVGCAIIHLGRVPNGDGRRHMILVALAPTHCPDGRRTPAPHGVWTVEVKNAGKVKVKVVNAWIERDDPPFGDHGPRRQSRFVNGSDGVTGKDTLNSVGTGARPIVVGGFRLCDRTTAKYSADGAPSTKGSTHLPVFYAASDDGAAFPGLRAAGARSGITHRMNGTSVAAPSVTRKVIHILGEEIRKESPGGAQQAAGSRGSAPTPPPDMKTRLSDLVKKSSGPNTGGPAMQIQTGASARRLVCLSDEVKRLPP